VLDPYDVPYLELGQGNSGTTQPTPSSELHASPAAGDGAQSSLELGHQCAMTAFSCSMEMPAGLQPVAAMPSRRMKGSGRKGTVKLRWVPTAGLNEQSGLNCTGCVPPSAGRATTGSMVRKRSTCQKPLYLQRHLSRVGWDGETMRLDSARLYVLSWRTRSLRSMVDLPFSSTILCRQG
jgi:hypothetical protein